MKNEILVKTAADVFCNEFADCMNSPNGRGAEWDLFKSEYGFSANEACEPKSPHYLLPRIAEKYEQNPNQGWMAAMDHVLSEEKKAFENKQANMEFEFCCDSDLRKFAGNAFFRLTTTIAEISMSYNDVKIHVKLTVRTKINVEYGGKRYKTFAKLPDEVKQLLESNCGNQTNMINRSKNNFIYNITVTYDDGSKDTDWEDFSGNPADFTPEKLERKMRELCMDQLNGIETAAYMALTDDYESYSSNNLVFLRGLEYAIIRDDKHIKLNLLEIHEAYLARLKDLKKQEALKAFRLFEREHITKSFEKLYGFESHEALDPKSQYYLLDRVVEEFDKRYNVSFANAEQYWMKALRSIILGEE